MIKMRRRSFLAWAAVLSQIRRLSAQATLTLDGIEKLLAPGFRGPSFRPAESRVIRSGKSLEVRRIVYGPQGPQTRNAFRSWLSEFTTIHTADFQTTAGEGKRPTYAMRSWGRLRAFIASSASDTGCSNGKTGRFRAWKPSPKSAAAARMRGSPTSRSRPSDPRPNCGVSITGAPCSTALRASISTATTASRWAISMAAASTASTSASPREFPNRLYLNRGDGTFEDITRTSGVDLLDNTACALFADFITTAVRTFDRARLRSAAVPQSGRREVPAQARCVHLRESPARHLYWRGRGRLRSRRLARCLLLSLHVLPGRRSVQLSNALLRCGERAAELPDAEQSRRHLPRCDGRSRYEREQHALSASAVDGAISTATAGPIST